MIARRAFWLRAAMTATLFFAGCNGGPDPRDLPPRVRIGEHEWAVEIVDDDPSRIKGMAGRTEAPEGTGMLFVFPSQRVHVFHMLDCLIPLDVAFINTARDIVEIRTMDVEPDPASPLNTYSSVHGALYALEVAGGTFDRLGIKPGDSVELLGAARVAAKDAR